MTARQKFPRTECACSKCRVGCHTMPGMLAVGDLEAIAAAEQTHLSLEAFALENFVVSDGPKAIAKIGDTVVLATIPTIVPAQLASGDCVFLAGDGSCSIHAVSPFGCSKMDSHMDRKEGDVRVREAILEIVEDCQKDGTYTEIAKLLARAGHTAPPLVQRRQAFEREYATC
jgi:hypothetical protein